MGVDDLWRCINVYFSANSYWMNFSVSHAACDNHSLWHSPSMLRQSVDVMDEMQCSQHMLFIGTSCMHACIALTVRLLTKREAGVSLNPHLASICPCRKRRQDVSLGQKLHEIIPVSSDVALSCIANDWLVQSSCILPALPQE